MTFNQDAKIKYKYLAILLRSRRIKNNLTQFELTKKLKSKRKVHVQFVSNWERGICEPPEHCVNNLMKLLDIDQKTLVKAMEKDAIEKTRRRLYATITKDLR